MKLFYNVNDPSTRREPKISWNRKQLKNGQLKEFWAQKLGLDLGGVDGDMVGDMIIDLFHVEVKDVVHVSGQFSEQCVEAPSVADVGRTHRPHSRRSQHPSPRHGRRFLHERNAPKI